MKVVILAGGKGTRLGELTKTMPKPLIEIGGKSVIEHQISLLAKQGLKEFIITTNYLSEVIKDKLGDGSELGVKIEYYIETEPLGTAGSLYFLREKLQSDFLVVYGDLFFNIDIGRLLMSHEDNIRQNPKVLATLVVHPNNHPYDSDLVEVDSAGIITAIHKKPHNPDSYYRNLVNAAVYVCRPELIGYIKKSQVSDFAHDIFPQIIASGVHCLCAYSTSEYLKDMGTPDRLVQAQNDFVSGRYQNSNLAKKQIAIFLDRDGTINREVDNLCQVNDFELLENSAKAIELINQTGLLAIVITNQPVVAKGMATMAEVELINRRMETELGAQGAWLDAVYYCPHHPDKGFAGEVNEYKIICQCRKPEIGLILEAANKYNIDLSKSYFIGDTSVDAETAQRAGVQFVGVKTGYGCQDGKYSAKVNVVMADILEAVKYILKLDSRLRGNDTTCK